MPATHLHLKNIGPFDDVEFDFNQQVNVFTGPNNSGKSTALWVLGEILVYPFGFPRKLLRPGDIAEFEINVQGRSDTSLAGQLPITPPPGRNQRDSEDRYWNDERWAECIAVLESVGYSKFIPALRRSTDFRSPGPKVTEDDEGEEIGTVPLPDGDSFLRHLAGSSRSHRRRRGLEENPELRKRSALISSDVALVSDETVIQKIVELDYRSYLRGKKELRIIIDKIGEMASQITDGFVRQFSGVDEDAHGFYPRFETIDGTLPLNTVSQGTQSVIQWLAHLLMSYAEYYDFPANLRDQPGVLIVDEIDAHMHPSWQRNIIPTLIDHLPNLQVFCSTHSPLMLAGLKEGQVQLLRRDEQGKVAVFTNQVDIVGWSADEILRSFLGVPNPTDLKTVYHLDRLKELRAKDDLTEEETEELKQLRYQISHDLLNGPVSGLVERFADEIKQAIGDSISSPTTRSLTSTDASDSMSSDA